MPQAIAWGIASVVGSATVTTGILVAAYAVTIVGTLALSSYQKNKAERAARSQFDAAQVDRLANVPGTVVPRELVLGRIRKGGHVFFKTSVGQFKELFIMCVAVAEHEIDGIEQIYLNDQPVDVNEVGQVTTAPYGQAATISDQKISFSTTVVLDHDPLPGSVSATESPFGMVGGHEVQCSVDGRVVTIINPLPGWYFTVYYQYAGFNSFVNIRWHLGSPDQTADGGMTAMLPGVWTWDHRARGVAYLVCQFAYNDTALPSGIPTVTARIRGARVYDPRDGATRFSENPALLMRHVITHPQFGKRTSISAAEDARFIAAANACDTGISYTGSDWVPMFRAASVFPFGSRARDVLDDLAQAMGGEWAYAAGEFYVRAGVYQLPVMDLTDEDLVVEQRAVDGSVTQLPMTISPHRPRAEKVNMVAIRIWDQAANYVETAIRPLRADALVADDGAELSQEVTMPAVFYAGQAWHIAGIMLRDGRDPMTAILPFKMRAYPLEIFDGIRLTLTRYGIVNKEFRIVGRTFNPNGVVQLSLKETTAAIFQYGAGFLPGGYAPNTGLPKPWDIRPPSILSISSGEDQLIVQNDGTIINGVRVTWAPIADQSIAIGGNVELQYMVLPSSPWVSVLVPGDAKEVKFYGVEDLAMIMVRLRTRNSLAVSDWGAQVLHQVIGKTEPPPNIENLSISGSVLSWTMPRRVPDLAGFVFRFQYGNNLDWNSAAQLHNGLITESPYDLITRPGGVVTIMGKAQDTSGNQSLATANIVMNLGDPPIANILEQWNFDALGWPYDTSESSGWTIVAGDPSADALDSFYGTDDQSFYGGDTQPFYDAGTYGRMIYVTPPVSINSALAGSIMTLDAGVQGTDLHIDYRLAGPGSFYGQDTDSFYGPDAEPFYGPPGAWMPWPGQIIAARDAYQFRVTIGAGTDRGILQSLVLTVDAPDIEEEVADLVIAAGGTLIPYTKNFTSIKTIQITLQANGSGAVTAESTKTPNLSPKVTAYNAAHTSVAGASADITLKGY
ncbi:phage tail protein [Variovorax sp. AB1(2024)]|uniref:phage tail protein n=1 Tax=Variovorax sp. AB1(2024) TaxID=3132214 RepID=UPI00309FF3A0